MEQEKEFKNKQRLCNMKKFMEWIILYNEHLRRQFGKLFSKATNPRTAIMPNFLSEKEVVFLTSLEP